MIDVHHLMQPKLNNPEKLNFITNIFNRIQRGGQISKHKNKMYKRKVFYMLWSNDGVNFGGFIIMCAGEKDFWTGRQILTKIR